MKPAHHIRHTPKERAALNQLAASNFDPDDYKCTDGGKKPGHQGNCKICQCRYAPNRVCGYCRFFVRAIREAGGTADIEKTHHCWEPGPDTEDGEEQTCFMLAGHKGPCTFIPNSEIKAILDKKGAAS